MNILITNVYCSKNKGDAGIIIAMIEQLRESFKGCNITLVSLYPELDYGQYGDNVTVISAPILPNQNFKPLYRFSYNIIKYIKGIIFKQELSYASNSFVKSIQNSDLIISCGGGFMQSMSFKYFLSDFIFHYVQLKTAFDYKKKYVIFAQTIGPFDCISRTMVRPIIENASIVLTREEISYQYTKKYFPKSNAYLTADIAFLLEKKFIPIKIDKNKINIGITVRKWNYPNKPYKQRNLYEEKYINSIISFLKTYSKDENLNFYIMPQVVGPGLDNDLTESQKIFSALSGQSNVHILEMDLLPGELKYIYSKMDYFIGTRMHSNIFSLSEYVPCLAISYDNKTDGIMEMIDESQYVIKIDEISTDILKEKFNRLITDKSYAPSLESKIEQIKKLSYKNIELTKKIYNVK